MSADLNERITHALNYSAIVGEALVLALSEGDPDNPDDPIAYNVKLVSEIQRQLEDDLGPKIGRSIFIGLVFSLPDRRRDLFFPNDSLRD